MSVANLFFLLSGEHESLPASELKTILDVEGYAYEVSEKLDQVLRLRADLDCVKALEHRAAFTRVCGLELFNCDAEISSIMKAAASTSLDEVLNEDESIAVRVKHIKNYASQINGMALEGKIGALIVAKNDGIKVNLRSPDKTLVGILTNDRFVFGLKLAEVPAKPFVERRPRRKPFFHPSAMTAKLARCMVNLAKPKAGDLILDPFCGTGTMLIEAALIGCHTLGLDIQRRMIKGTLRNMTHFKTKPTGVAVADARSLPFIRVDCVVTDPPYGISSTTLKRTARQIIEEVLTAVSGLLDKGRRICIAAPKKLDIRHTGMALGYKHLESHFVYVHRSLTREIIVFEKV
jgi:tRNA (guanine10-N2)-dimethyltransferase